MKQLFKLSLASVLVAGSMAVQAGTLADVLDRGELHCGVTTGVTGFSAPDSAGNWTGIDVDGCRSVAAAVFGDASKVKYVPLTAKERFTALQSGEIDVLYRNTTWTMQRDASLGLNFAGVNYYDGQGFMVMKSLGVSDAMEMSGASVCIQTGTTTELNLADFFRANKIKYEPVPIETNSEARAGYLAERCDVYTTDASGLAATKSTFKDADLIDAAVESRFKSFPQSFLSREIFSYRVPAVMVNLFNIIHLTNFNFSALNVYWVVVISIVLTLLCILFYISNYIIPQKAEELLEETYPEYKLAKSL